MENDWNKGGQYLWWVLLEDWQMALGWAGRTAGGNRKIRIESQKNQGDGKTKKIYSEAIRFSGRKNLPVPPLLLKPYSRHPTWIWEDFGFLFLSNFDVSTIIVSTYAQVLWYSWKSLRVSFSLLHDIGLDFGFPNLGRLILEKFSPSFPIRVPALRTAFYHKGRATPLYGVWRWFGLLYNSMAVISIFLETQYNDMIK